MNQPQVTRNRSSLYFNPDYQLPSTTQVPQNQDISMICQGSQGEGKNLAADFRQSNPAVTASFFDPFQYSLKNNQTVVSEHSEDEDVESPVKATLKSPDSQNSSLEGEDRIAPNFISIGQSPSLKSPSEIQ